MIGSLILRAVRSESENAKSDAIVEGGPLIVALDSASALMYARLLVEIVYVKC